MKTKARKSRLKQKKPEDANKIWNHKSNARKLPIQEKNAQRYPSFNDYFQCNKFGYKVAVCRSI